MFKVLDKQDVSYMDQILFDENNLIRVLPSCELLKLPPEHIMIWGNLNGVYTFPTTELIDFLKEKIDAKNTIEICAGNGCIGRALGITSTDSYMQTRPEIIAFYKSVGQKPIQPPIDVQKFEATEAIKLYNPKTVVASYATQISKKDDYQNSSQFGVDEETIMSNVETYIHIGNSSTHATKRIVRKYYHDLFRFPWLVTRSVNPQENEIRIFRNEQKYAK
jgi:hypothetical protein